MNPQQENLQEPLLPERQESEAITTRAVENDEQQPHQQEASENNEDEDDHLDKYRRNIPVMLWYQFIRGGAEAIWLGSVLSSYVYLIRPDHPETVGYLSAIEGITQLIVACTAGYLADKYRRDSFCRMASLIGVVASILIVLSTTTTGIFWFLILALSLNGAFDGITLTATLAVFADSIREGDRSYYFTQRTLCTTLGQFLGPVFGLIMFFIMGDKWTIPACARVMVTAQVLLSPAFVLLWYFKDVEPHQQRQQQQRADLVETENNDNNNDEIASPLLSTDDTEAQEDCTDTNNDTTVEAIFNNMETTTICCNHFSKRRFIAICAASSDFFCSFAGGISFRYFAIFFLKDLHFGPVLVQILDALSLLGASGLLIVAQKASLKFGRSPVSVAFKVAGIVFLLFMVFSYQYQEANDGAASSSSSLPLSIAVCVLYLLQNAFFNSTQALTRSLIMDNVPSEERARWSALESICIFGWCGSAAVGGVIVKMCNGNVIPAFFVTIALQVVGILPLMALFGVETKEQGQQEDAMEG